MKTIFYVVNIFSVFLPIVEKLLRVFLPYSLILCLTTMETALLMSGLQAKTFQQIFHHSTVCATLANEEWARWNLNRQILTICLMNLLFWKSKE